MKIERYIIVKDNQWVVRSYSGRYRYVPLSDPDVLNKAFIFKTYSSAKQSSKRGWGKHNENFKIVKISGELTLDDKIEE